MNTAQITSRPLHRTHQAPTPPPSAPPSPHHHRHPRKHVRTGRRRLKKMHHPISTKTLSNPVRCHLLVAVTRVCALLVFLISSPLLYCTSTQVVASSFVTTISAIAFFGLINNQHHSPSLPFDPSPPIVLHIINRTTFPPKYSSRCTTFYIRPTQPTAKHKPPSGCVTLT
jgi:hypothetical protein